MIIQLHIENGSTILGQQSDPQLQALLLLRLSPQKVFKQPALILVYDDSVTTVRGETVESILLIGGDLSRFRELGGVYNLKLLSPEDFQELTSDRDKFVALRRSLKPGDEVVGYASIEMQSGRQVYFEYSGNVRAVYDQKIGIKNLFSAGCLVALEDGDGSATIVNLAKAVSVRLFPGPPADPGEAWPLQEPV